MIPKVARAKTESPRTRSVAIGAVSVVAALLSVSAFAGDWPNWRGPENNGAARETKLPGEWELRWKAPFGGRSTPVVHNGRVYVLNRAGSGVNEQERVLCVDAKSGDVLWEHRFGVYLTDIPSTRIGWASPVVDPETGHVYAHGVQNTFICLDRDGKVIWRRQLHEEYGTINGYGGRTHTPIIDEDRVVISFLNSSWGPQAPGRHRYVAFDKRTGAVQWWATPGGPPLDTTYSVPVVAVVGGVRQLIAGNADGNVYGMEARTGRRLWTFRVSKRGINASLVEWNGKVFVSHSEENIDEASMGRVICIDATGRGDITKTHEVWRQDGITAGYASPAISNGRCYVADNSANLHCYDATTGTELWAINFGTVAKGSPVVADGKIYICEVNGKFLILDAGETKSKILSTKEFHTDDGVVEMFGSPAIAGGRIYFNTRDELYCLGAKEWDGSTAEAPAAPTEVASADAKATLLHVVPADVVLEPGQSIAFGTKAFDDTGRAVELSGEAEWSVVGVEGEISASGKLTVSAANSFGQGFVVAKLGDLEGRARIRTTPPIPFSVDFSGVAATKPPAGWVGAGIKFVGAEYKGEAVLTKPGTRSKFMDAETFFGLSTWRNYTIEADVLAIERKRNLPNIGVINSGYEFVLMGNHQRLRIVSWVPQPRIEKKVRFKWDPEVWYRMKFRVAEKGGVATLQGKVWKRDDAEPEAWTVELEDPNPNGGGAPALHGYSAGARAKSAGAQIYYDNVKVTRN